MADNTLLVKLYNENEIMDVNENEIWRYSGYSGNIAEIDDELKAVMKQVRDELAGSFSYKVCYRRMAVSWENDTPVLPFHSESKNLAKCIRGCNEIVLFAATVGHAIDRKIARYQRFSPVKALMMQAYGAERVESLCDTFNKEIKEMAAAEGLRCAPRFSPGYGDLPLEAQIQICELLDCSRQIGVTLNESLLMSPSKSVTAIIGIGAECREREKHKCSNCNKKNCEFRK